MKYLPQESVTIRTISGIEITIPAQSIQEIIVYPSEHESAEPDEDKPKPVITPPWPTKRKSERHYDRDPRAAAVGSCIFPGLGQLLNREPDRAAVFIALNVLGAGFIVKAHNDNVHGKDIDGDDAFGFAGIFLTTGIWLYAIVDAYQSSERQSRRLNVTPIMSKTYIG